MTDSRSSAEAGNPEGGVQIPVPYLDQSREAPTGCESVTAVMLLNYLGYPVTIKDFIDEDLEKELFFERDGRLYGPDPSRAFAGDPCDPDSMGCYAPVLVRALGRVLGERYEIIDETGSEIEDLIGRYLVEENMPVPLWATIDLKPSIEGPSWYLSDTGERFTWRSNEHCMLLTGFDEENYIFNDPWNNNGVIAYPKDLVKLRHREQHMQAVGVRRRA